MSKAMKKDKTKIFKKLISIVCIATLMFSCSSEIFAKLSSTAKDAKQKFGIEMPHASKKLNGKGDAITAGYATDTQHQPVYRIYAGEYSQKDYDTTILCLNKDKRYPTEKGQSNAEYTSLGPASEETLKQVKSDIDSTKTKKIQWLIKNAIIPEDSDALKNLKLEKIFQSDLNSDTVNKLTIDDIKNELTEDDVVFALQFALWEITNEISFGAPQYYNGKTWSALTGNKREYISKMITYYMDNCAKETDILPSVTGDVTAPTITYSGETEDNRGDSVDKIKPKNENGYIFLGPFKIENEHENVDYSVKITLQTSDGTETTDNYFITDGTGTDAKRLSCTKSGLNGKDFYIQLRTRAKARKIKIEVETQPTMGECTGTVWKKEEQDQPLLSIERTENPGQKTETEKDFDITIQDNYDVALRKHIKNVKRQVSPNQWQLYWNPESEGSSVSSEKRTPEKSVEKNADAGAFNQYDYIHRKDPLEVKVGDRITYEITVINEGTESVRVTQITDYLPPSGLKYVEDANDKQWTNNSAKNSYVTNKLEGIVIYSGQKQSVEIVLEVTDDAIGKVVTNIAEITGMRDGENTSTKEDIDSRAGNVELPTNEDDWQNYKGNDEEFKNPDDLSQTNYYYKGQEDDDDFEKIIVPGTIDLALRKSITSVNGNTKDRMKDPDVSPLKDERDDTTTSVFTDEKTPVSVKTGDVVVYNIRVFNEGEEKAIASAITDYIPEGLGFLPEHQLNVKNGWIAQNEGSPKTVKLATIPNATNNLSQSDFTNINTDYKEANVIVGKAQIKTTKLDGTFIEGFDKSQSKLDKKELQIACVVLSAPENNNMIQNIAAITEYKNSSGEVIDEDIDSDTRTQIDPGTYPTDKNIQDDDDYEKLVLTQGAYDLALKKFITSVTSASGELKTIPEEQKRKLTVTDSSPLVDRDATSKADANYDLNKTTVDVDKGDYVIYTIRVFNEGAEAATVKQIIDSLPEGLEFVTYETDANGAYLSGSKTNFKYGWEKYQESEMTVGWMSGLSTTYLSKTVIPGFDKSMETDLEHKKEKGISYEEVQLELRVVTDEHTPIKNIAEIMDDDGEDIDSTPNNKQDSEDDQDYDIIIPQKFDLALRKYITKIGDKEISDRVPTASYSNGKLEYSKNEEPRVVVQGQHVTYTIRVYNEGTKNGYAAEIKDDIPEGLEFLPDDATNIKYGWKMYDSEGKQTSNIADAVTIRTDYLSKEKSEERNEDNLIKAFDSTESVTDDNPDHREIEVVFEVAQKNATDEHKTIINTAEISKDQDENGKEVEDTDSTPDNDDPDEDDIDKEYLELKYFDLSLLKYVSKVIVTEDGVTKETETGYDGSENPEPVVKVEINKKKLDKTEVKYVYSIKITNEGEIEGYATEITDRIPEGLAFYEEDNTQYNWKIKEDGIVTTDYLKDTLLKPGQSAEIQIVLRWVKSEKNLGQKVNTAEISDDDNDYDIPDIDSTPNNNKEGEDDQDNAIVVLSINTGSSPTYTILIIIGIIAILGVGIYTINKYILKR